MFLLQTSPTAQDAEIIGFLVGLMCTGVLGIVAIVGLLVYFARKKRDAAPIVAAGCPSCGSTSAKAVRYTWWGGVLGPKLFDHVECASCGAGYNAKTGKSNTTAIAIYLGVTFAIFGGLAVAFFIGLS